MNSIRFQHSAKNKEDGTPSYTVGGKGKVFINGHEISGVLDFVPNLMDENSVASVTITLAVSKFTFGPDEWQYATYRTMEGDREVRIPTVKMRD